MNIPSTLKGCEAHGICFAETDACATGHCAQAKAARVYSDLFPHLSRERGQYQAPDRSAERAKDQALADQAAERIRYLDENAILMAVWFGFCCVLFWLMFIASVIVIYKADEALRTALRSGFDAVLHIIALVSA